MMCSGQPKVIKAVFDAKEHNNQLGEHDSYVMLHQRKQSHSRVLLSWRVEKVGAWTAVQTLSDFNRSYAVSSRIGALG